MTVAMSRAPVMTLMTSEETSARRRALRSAPISRTPAITPTIPPRAAEDRHAAEQDGGDDGQLEADGVVAAGGAVAQRPEDAGERGDDAR